MGVYELLRLVDIDSFNCIINMSALPAGWEQRQTADGKTFYVDHNTKQTHWALPPEVAQQAGGGQPQAAPQQPAAAPSQPKAAPPQQQQQQQHPKHHAVPQSGHHGALTIAQFLEDEKDRVNKAEKFHLHCSDRLLGCNITEDQFLYACKGSMISYTGNIKFKAGSGGSIGQKLLKAATSEGVSFMRCSGNGTLYIADDNKTIIPLYLENDAIIVNGSDVLAMEPSLKWEIKAMKGGAGIMQGGFLNVHVSGTGVVAVTTHGKPFVMVVRPGETIHTDPNSTVCWSSNLSPSLTTDVNVKTLIGRSSGETLQMAFNAKKDQGFVVCQPYEELPKVGNR